MGGSIDRQRGRAGRAAAPEGDLVFNEGSDPGPGGAPGHVGLYIGGNTIIDAPHTGANVELTTLSAGIHQLVAIRRMVPA